MRNTARALSASAVLLTALALAGCGDGEATVAEDPAEVSGSPTAATTSAAPTPLPSPTATETTPAADVLITLDTPAEGATVSGSIDVSGTANSPEANVPWQLLGAGGDVVADGFFTAEGWMDALYPYAGTVDLAGVAPGEYVLKVSVDDPSGGEGNPPQSVERHLTVH